MEKGQIKIGIGGESISDLCVKYKIRKIFRLGKKKRKVITGFGNKRVSVIVKGMLRVCYFLMEFKGWSVCIVYTPAHHTYCFLILSLELCPVYITEDVQKAKQNWLRLSRDRLGMPWRQRPHCKVSR